MSSKAFFLIVIILLCGIFIFLKVEVLGDPNSSFNKTTRFSLGRYQISRSILGLHDDGDARAWFLQGNSAFTVEIVQAPDAKLNELAIKDFVAAVAKYTGRPIALYNEDLLPAGTLTQSQLADAVTNFRRHHLLAEPDLFIMYTDDYEHPGSDTELGKTWQEYGIVLSDQGLKNVTKNFPSSLEQYQESTLLHEFGHQIGLDHNDQPNCIMNAKVEHPASFGAFSGDFTATDFCPFEVDQINVIKASL